MATTSIAIPDPVLEAAINASDLKTLQRVLKHICRTSNDCTVLASSQLLVVKDTTSGNFRNISDSGVQKRDLEQHRSEDGDDGDDSDDKKDHEGVENDDQEAEATYHASEPSPKHDRPLKRKYDETLASPLVLVSRYETCMNCNQRFDITKNTKDACKFHDGEKELDPEEFPDDDEIEMGHYIDVDNDWRVELRPEGFPWSCCGANADGPPCVIQAHMILQSTQ